MDADNDTDDDPDRDAGPGGGESDGRLLSATAAGDAEAFGRFYPASSTADPRLRDRPLRQRQRRRRPRRETFLGALRSAPRFTDRDGEATAWLFGIARHMLAHQRRAFTRRQRLATRLQALPRFAPDEAVAIDAAIDAARLAPQLAAALNTLKPKDRELLQLVSGDGLSPTQAGALLGMNPNTARVPPCPAPAPDSARHLLIPKTRHRPTRPLPTRIPEVPHDHPQRPSRPAPSPAVQPGHGAVPAHRSPRGHTGASTASRTATGPAACRRRRIQYAAAGLARRQSRSAWLSALTKRAVAARTRRAPIRPATRRSVRAAGCTSIWLRSPWTPTRAARSASLPKASSSIRTPCAKRSRKPAFPPS